MRNQLVVAYDGTDFSGWAAQTGLRTVQSTLKEAVRRVSGEEVEIVGASRTDSGTHARGQVCHFDTQAVIPTENWIKALNRQLGPDISVQSAKHTGDRFHARFGAISRHYRYRISLATIRNPQQARYFHEYGRMLDVGLMQQAAESLVGEHDFRAYTEELDPHVENTVRKLFTVNVKQVRDEVWVDVVGTAFLRGMMRRMSGVLLEVGRYARPVEEVSKLLTEEREIHQWPVVLPARGLCLMHVRYGRRYLDHRSSLPSE